MVFAIQNKAYFWPEGPKGWELGDWRPHATEAP
jgi:hypothetical protein